MSKRQINQNQKQRVRTKVPTQQAIAAFFNAKTGLKTKPGDESDSKINLGVISLIDEEKDTKTLEVKKPVEKFGLPVGAFGYHNPLNDVINKSFVDHKENTIDSSLTDIENCNVIAEDEIDDAYLLLIAEEQEETDYFNQPQAKQARQWQICTDMLRGKIMDIRPTSSNVEVQLSGESIPNRSVVTIILGGYWAESSLEIGDICHVFLNNEQVITDTTRIFIEDGNEFLVVHPDSLVSATSLVGSLNCIRQTVLNDKLPFPSVSIHSPTTNKPMLIGKAVHLLFQWVLVQQLEFKRYPDKNAIVIRLNEIFAESEFLQNLYSIGQSSSDEIVKEITSLYVPAILQFSTSAVGELSGLRDIEENVWSPRFGVKGKVDASITLSRNGKNYLVPLELKTGQASKSKEHFGQAMLYSLLLADRYGNDTVPEYGLLSYLKNANKDTSCIRVPRSANAIQGLLQTRNDLAHFLAKPWSRNPLNLPPPVLNERTCSWCPQSVNCALMHLADPDENSRNDRKLSSLVSTLSLSFSEEEVAFWVKWMELLNAEYGQQENISEWLGKFWSLPLEEMESTGLTLGHLVLKQVDKQENGSNEPDYCLHFIRKNQHSLPDAIFSSFSPFNNSFSVDGGFRPRMLISSCEPGDQKFTGLSFVTLQDIVNKNHGELVFKVIAGKNYKKLYPNITEYRLDVVSSTFSSGFSYKMAVSNLSTMFDNFPHFQRIRSLIVGHRLPQKKNKLKKGDMELFLKMESFLNLTRKQKEVCLRVLTAEDYLLIQGYPGTGKSTTIAALVRCLIALGQSVIVAAYTNTAVDSILIKLVDDFSKDEALAKKLLRLGPIERIAPAVRRFAERSRLESIKSLESLTELYERPCVIAGTCHALSGHAIFSRRRFSVCILDEASQTLLPLSLGPILCADRFALIGDPNQLSPLVVNAVKEAEMCRHLSLLELLMSHCEKSANKDAICTLTEQFRMNSELLRVPNTLYYENNLTFSKSMSSGMTLKVEQENTIKSKTLQKIISNDLSDSFLFLDTGSLNLPQDVLSSSNVANCTNSKTSNLTEALVVSKIVDFLLKSRVSSHEIGVISQFNDQVRLIEKLLLRDDIEVNTVDQYQGREKAVIIISFVKTALTGDDSQHLRMSRGILTSGKRLNVALTRAQKKLIAIGSRDYLAAAYTPIADMIEILRDDQTLRFTLSDFNSFSDFISS